MRKNILEIVDIENHPTREYRKRKPVEAAAAPIVQWVGGKRQLLAEYEKHFPETFGDYYEPFLGGGAVFFDMHKKHGTEKNYYLSDMNKELIITYETVRDNPAEVAELLENFSEKHSKEFYYEVRNVDRVKVGTNKYEKTMDVTEQLSTTSIASRFLYLNKTCFNALYRVNSSNLFNVPVGKSLKKDLRDDGRLAKVSEVLSGPVSLSCTDYEKLVSSAKPGDFVYFDPPYEPISTTADFTSYTTDGFSFADQERLKSVFDSLTERGVKAALSNSDAKKITDLYKDYRIVKFDVNRCLNSDGKKRKNAATEILVLNW
jgi:DNA adenine methylase